MEMMGRLVLLLLVVVATNCMLTQARPSRSLREGIRELLMKVRQPAQPACGVNKYNNSETGISTIEIFPKPSYSGQLPQYSGSFVPTIRENVEMDDRIFNGNEAKRGEFPWMVVVYVGPFRCGGSIISQNMILTAAHCVLKNRTTCQLFNTSVMTVTTMEHNRFKLEGENNYTVQAVHMHPFFTDCESLDLDYAILELNNPIAYTKNIQPICLPPFGSPVPYGAKCIAAGWGMNPAGDNGVLHWLRLDVMNQPLCDRIMAAFDEYVPKPKFCTVSLSKVGDVCRGDSGGPLMCKAADGRYYVYGVVSTGPPCWLVWRPGLWGSVPFVRNWIYATMQGDDTG